MRDSSVRRLSRLHTILYRSTGGLVGRRLVNNDMLLLTTTGRKTGSKHTVPLLYLTDGHRLVVIASYGGRDHHPDWYLNLEREPTVTVQVSGRRKKYIARTADAEQRAHWWPRIVDGYYAYAAYQSRTERQVPVVFLEPEAAGRPRRP